MKKLIGFLFLLLIVKYNLGDYCKDDSTTDCKDREVSNEKALCLKIDETGSCDEFECKDLYDTMLDFNDVKGEDLPFSDFESCVFNEMRGEYELRLKECSQVSRDSEETCNQHPVHSGNEATHICAFDSSNKKCIEQYLCESVPASNTEINCETYPVKKDNQNTHICIYDSSNKKCIQQYLCESVPTSDTEINCETYPVKKANQNTHTCVKDTDGTKPCKEQVKNIPTTVPNMETTIIVQTTKNKETVLPLTSTVLNIVQTTKNKETVLPLISTVLNMENTTKIVQTTIPLMYVPTTIIEDKMLAILLGCRLLTLKTDEFTFICYFHPKNSILSQIIGIPIEITYYTYLRRLENFIANCTLNETNRQTLTYYNCIAEIPTANINQIKLREFNPENNIKLVGITPLAEMFFDNFLEADKKYGNLFSNKKFIYILNNSTIEKIKSKKIEINGNIDGDKPKIFVKNKDLILIVNTESESETENKTTELNCTVGDIKGDNYTLICNITENIKYDLQNSLSIIDSEILLINFDNNENNVVLNETEKLNFRNYRKKSKGLSTGAIVSIILASIVVVASVIGFAYFGAEKKKILSETNSLKSVTLNNFQN